MLIIVFFCVASDAAAQVVFDTLYLREFEIVALKNDYKKFFKQTDIDTLIKKEFEHYDLGALLSSFSPVFIKSYGKGSIASASFRGTSASHTQVLWNGFSINSPMLGQVDFSYVPESFFDEVRLIFGGGTLSEQSGALGGTVLLNNFNETGNKPFVHFNQSVGSFGTYNTAAGFHVKKGKFVSSTALSFQTAENNFKYYNNGIIPSEWMTQKDAQYLNTGFQQHLSFSINSNNTLDIITWNQWNNRNIPPIMTNVQKGGNRQEYQDDFFSRNIIAWNWHKGKHAIDAKFGYFYEYQHYFLKTTTDNLLVVTLINSKNKTSGYYFKSLYSKEINGNWKLKAGIDFMRNVVKSNNYRGCKLRNTFSLKTEAEKQFFGRMILNFLVRGDVTDGYLLPLMPFVGINYKLLKNRYLFVRGTVSKNYHLPTLNDLYWYPGGNSDLIPEDATSFDVGVNYLKTINEKVTLNFDVSAYYTLINNWIQWKPSDYRFWMPENIGFVKARGVEFSSQLNGKAGGLKYRLSLKYAFTKTTDESEKALKQGYAGRQLIYVPVHHGNFFAFFAYKSWSLNWLAVFTGKRNTTTDPQNDYSNILPSYVLNNLKIGKKVKLKSVELSTYFKVDNLFNIQYQAVLWRAMPGRSYEFSVRFNWK